MALANDNTLNHYNSGSVTTDTFSYTTGAISNGIMVVFVYTNGTGGDIVTGVTYNGVALTKQNAITINGATQFISAWELVNPATGANNIVVNTSAATDIGTWVSTYSGAKQTSQPDSINTGSASGNVTLSTTVVAANSWLVSATRNSSVGVAGAGTGTTIRGTTTSVPFAGGDSNGTVSTGSQSMQWTAGAGTTAGCIMSISPGVSSLSNLALLGIG